MNLKINTKEKFHAITLPGPSLSAGMTDELGNLLIPFLQYEVKNIVLNLKEIQDLDEAAAKKLVFIQQKYYDNNASFVICGLRQPVEAVFDKMELLEIMNVTPTESEAGDIVQMEEIEREMMSGDAG